MEPSEGQKKVLRYYDWKDESHCVRCIDELLGAPAIKAMPGQNKRGGFVSGGVCATCGETENVWRFVPNE